MIVESLRKLVAQQRWLSLISLGLWRLAPLFRSLVCCTADRRE